MMVVENVQRRKAGRKAMPTVLYAGAQTWRQPARREAENNRVQKRTIDHNASEDARSGRRPWSTFA